MIYGPLILKASYEYSYILSITVNELFTFKDKETPLTLVVSSRLLHKSELNKSCYLAI